MSTYLILYLFSSHCWYFTIENLLNTRKVLLRERKRHTAHGVASARSATLSPGGGRDVPASRPNRGGGEYPHPVLTGGYYLHPVPTGGGVPPSSPDRGLPHPVPLSAGWGYPHPPLPNQLDGVSPPLEMWTERHLWTQYLPHSFGMRAIIILIIFAIRASHDCISSSNYIFYFPLVTSSSLSTWFDWSSADILCPSTPVHVRPPEATWKVG